MKSKKDKIKGRGFALNYQFKKLEGDDRLNIQSWLRERDPVCLGEWIKRESPCHYAVYQRSKLVGCVLAGERYKQELEVALLICPQQRKQGIGTSVFRAIPDCAERLFGKEVAYLSIALNTADKGLIPFLEKIGYLPFGFDDEGLPLYKWILRQRENRLALLAGSVAPCGKVCALCSFHRHCEGCRSESGCVGKRTTKEGCIHDRCCRQKEIEGCWQCEQHCKKGMFADGRDKRHTGFVQYIRQYGKYQLANRLILNEELGISYEKGGGYDNLYSEVAVVKKINEG